MKNISVLLLTLMLSVAGLTGCSKDSGSDRPTFNDPNPSNPGGNPVCIAIDTDADGLRDCEDPDIDNDGYLNDTDAFPYNFREWVDTDGDGYGDNGDWSPLDNTEWVDYDNDAIGDNADPDDDNDGVPDRFDSFRTRGTEYFDIDFDTFGFDEDPDSDNDGVPDQWDDLFWRAGGFDIDLDLLPNESDPDIDGDNTVNEADAFAYDPLESLDYDSDSLGNNADPDDDNDGVPDVWDAFQFNRNFQFDWDGDTYANDIDAFPYDQNEWIDSDGDGYGDNGDAFPNNPFEWADTDEDGVGNNTDPDIDNDGYSNQLPAVEVQQVECYLPRNEPTCIAVPGCGWTSQGRCAPVGSCIAGGVDALCDESGTDIYCRDVPSYNPKYPIINPASCNADAGCSWSGSSCEQLDFFPLDRFEHLDNDLDGLGDEQDADDDNDGFPDLWDNFKFRNDSFFDFDNDGIYDWQLPRFAEELLVTPATQYSNQIDPDSDNDGVPDFWDDADWDAAEYYDIDGDGIGNNLDQDDDGDGFADVVDAFPYDGNEAQDTDFDTIGNNADPDDDNDGAPDSWDDLVFNQYGMSDFNGDAVPDEVATDIDGDLYSNGDLVCTGVVNNFSCAFPTSIDVFIWDDREWYDEEVDGLGDNEDPDDDNDGVPDFWDDLMYNNEGFADMDEDNIPNQLDEDLDGDQVNNDVDVFPYDDLEWLDTDGDTIGDNTDPDADNDGVPTDWDDFPLDNRYWADNDGDGISNDLDIYTPNGINNEADIVTALQRGEQLTFTADINITTCYNIPANYDISSNDEAHVLTYMGPNDGCMFNVIGDGSSFNNIIFKMPSDKQGTFVKSTVATGLNSFALHQNIFDIEGKAKIVDLSLKGILGFTRNNMILKTNTNLGGTGYENLFLVRNGTSLVAADNVGFVFAGNIFFWEINVTQSAALSIFKSLNPVRSVAIQNNVLKMNKASSANIVPPTSFINFDFTTATTNEERGLIVSQNRVNMNAGQFVNLVSTQNALSPDIILAQGNRIFGITNVGNPAINQDNSDESANICVSYESESACEAEVQCDWSGVSCEGNGTVPNSYSTYYDFGASDVWLAPTRGDYSMHYYPNTSKVNNSPALFAGSAYDNELEVYLVDEKDLGQGFVYFVGFYPPLLDDDGDTFNNTIDDFDFNALEYFDNDSDGMGNNSDPDDDNDQSLDFAEKSYCAAELSDFTCKLKTGCRWDGDSQSCRKNVNGCLVAGSEWDYSALCCIKDSVCVDGSDPFVADTDHDGLSDYDEMYVYNTNPVVADTDGDNDSDSEEISNGTNPLDANSSKDTDGDGLNDNFERNNLIPLGCVIPQSTSDTDGDGLNDFEEFMTLNTNPCVTDTDNDGLTDFEEVRTYMTNPIDSDSDNDGLSDGEEVLTQGTNPNVVDSDGDGAGDGQEITDGTSPTSNTSFKDTDGDLESDYADKTPYGTVPCDNFTLNTCTNTYTPTQLRDRFNLQLTEAYSCASKTSSTTCNSNVFGLCKWNSGTSTCAPKDVVLFNDITLDDRCYTIPLAASNKTNIVKIRTKPNTRKNITLSNSLASASGCNPGEGVFTLLANTGLVLENLHFIAGSNLETIITNTVSTNRGGFSLETKGVSYLSERGNGSHFVKLRDYSKVSMEKTTLRQVLGTTPTTNPLSSVHLTYDGAFCPARTTQANCELSSAICSWNGSACVDRNVTQLSLKGNIFSCETENYMSNMFAQNRQYSCLQTQAPTTDFDGNVLMLDDMSGISQVDVSDPGNEMYAWKHTQGSGSFILRNSRIYSKSQSMEISNGSGSVTSTNLAIRDGASTSDFTWIGSLAPSADLVAGSTTYDGVFRTTTSAELACVLGTSGDASTIHPVYFNSTPVRSFWHLINRTGPSDAVQIPGAVGGLCTP